MNHLLGNTADEPNHGRKRPFLTSSTNSLPEFFAIANHQRPTTPPPPSTVEQPETTPTTETPPFPFQAPLVSRLLHDHSIHPRRLMMKIMVASVLLGVLS